MSATKGQPSPSSIGVLCMAYGTPDTLDDVEAFYTHIRGGRPPSPELLEELVERYKAIGGSPLATITRAQAQGVEAALSRLDGSRRYRAFVGMKHWRPFIADAVREMHEAGIQRAVGLTFAPHYSRLSVGGYIDAARKALEELGSPFRMTFIESWHLAPGFIQALVARVKRALERFENPDSVTVLFTAHSLPERILQWNDPYPRQLEETGRAVAQELGLQDWRCGWQSEGRTPEPWLGPDLLDLLEQLAAEGKRQVLVCPAGFLADHLEILYDIDLEAQEKARELGIHLERTDSLNADDDLVEALAHVVKEHLEATDGE